MHVDYEVSKKNALRLIIILAIITVAEVGVALVGKGYIIPGVHAPLWLMGLIMIGLSAFKAKRIVEEFMHVSYEVKSFGMTIVLPTLLLVWAVIAFLYEGGSWGHSRSKVKEELGGKHKQSSMIVPTSPAQDIYRFN